MIPGFVTLKMYDVRLSHPSCKMGDKQTFHGQHSGQRGPSQCAFCCGDEQHDQKQVREERYIWVTLPGLFVREIRAGTQAETEKGTMGKVAYLLIPRLTFS